MSNVKFRENSVDSCVLSIKGSKANGAEADKVSGNGGEMVSVEVHSPREETVVPAVGDIVTAKVLSVNQRWVQRGFIRWYTNTLMYQEIHQHAAILDWLVLVLDVRPSWQFV